MKVAVVTYHLPHPDGTATGRQVYAVWQAAREAGHDVTAWCWGAAPAGLVAPDWVTVDPVHDLGGWRRLPQTVRRPRWALASHDWSPPPDALCWAEEAESYAAVATAQRRAVTIAHSTLLDAIALRTPRTSTVQSMRAERHAVRRSSLAIGFSTRVARAVGVHRLVPVTLPVPEAPLDIVDEPVAALLADWAWPPNQAAARVLLDAWPAVRARLPGARLLLAGRGFIGRSGSGGVEVVGEVVHASDVLSRAAVLAFPCPATSGPKMKVLEALAHGLPVVTTSAGVEGLDLLPGATAVCRPSDLVATLAAVLADVDRRRRMAVLGRRSMLQNHTPSLAASRRMTLAAMVPVEGSGRD